jgi:hypothetical protein
MSRNRTKAIEILFDIIKIKFDLSSFSHLPNDFYNGRWIQGKELEEDWLSYAVFKSTIEISHELRFALIEYDSKLFIIATGLESPDKLPNGIAYFPINSGVFTAIVSELELPVKSSVTNLYLEQNILSQNNSDPLYEGHDMVDLLPIFPNIFIGEITPQFIGDNTNIHQIVCSYLANNKKFVPLPFSEATLDKLNDLVLLNSKILNYDSIIQSLLSSHFKFSFLDLYRCLEMLYQIIYIDDTHKKLALTIDKTDFLLAIDDKLNWRPSERNALKKLFAETPDPYRVEVENSIKKISQKKNELSDWLYDLRCSIVHLKSSHRNFELKPQEWDNLILGIGHLTIYWYQKYQSFN